MDFGGSASRVIAIHESGHAVASVLCIGRAGITDENAIRWIEMNSGTPHCSVFELPLDMPGLKDFGESQGIKEGTSWTVEQWRTLFSRLSIDPREWAGVRLFVIAAGAAEPGATGDFRFWPANLNAKPRSTPASRLPGGVPLGSIPSQPIRPASAAQLAAASMMVFNAPSNAVTTS